MYNSYCYSNSRFFTPTEHIYDYNGEFIIYCITYFYNFVGNRKKNTK